MAAGPIPWTSIVQWVRMRGIYDVEEINDFVDLIRDMEAVQREFEDSNDK